MSGAPSVGRRIALLAGGRSSEREVSLTSAKAVAAALASEGHDVVPVEISAEGAWTIEGRPAALVPDAGGRGALVDGGASGPVDVVFPVLHGPFGEDGTVQGLCETAGVAYVGAGVAPSALAMDKALFKMVLRDAGLPTTPSVVVTARRRASDPESARRLVRELGYPVFCKPARLGSSVGISRVAGPEELDAALDLALAHDSKAIVERGVEGREVEVGVLGNGEDLIVSPPGEIVYDAEWYDYETKYQPGRTRLEIPAELPPAVTASLKDLARRAYLAVECEGMARIDFFVREDGEVLVSELNTIPGFTPTSAYTRLMEAAGVAYGPLVTRLVELGIARAAEASSYRC